MVVKVKTLIFFLKIIEFFLFINLLIFTVQRSFLALELDALTKLKCILQFKNVSLQVETIKQPSENKTLMQETFIHMKLLRIFVLLILFCNNFYMCYIIAMLLFGLILVYLKSF